MSDRLAIDLEHLGLPGAICAYVLAGDEVLVIDPGPSTTLARLEGELERHGLPLEDLRHVVLTHVHLDHAGAAGHILERAPRARVWVHVDGAPHVVDPERLVASTRRTFGDAHDRLWGDVRPVPGDRVVAWRPGEPGPVSGLRPVPSPGHIGHHVAFLDESSGTLFAGDALGIVLHEDAPTHPPTPPPAVDLAAWYETLERLEALDADRFGVTHFGLHGSVRARCREMGDALRRLEARVRAWGRPDPPPEYEHEVRELFEDHLPAGRAERYFEVFSAAADWAGVHRYLRKTAG